MEKIQYKRLIERISQNYRLTNLYSLLLNGHEEAITKPLIDELTEDGTTREAAVVAVLCEMFGLDFDEPADRYFIRNYLTRSVREMDKKKYLENPYYKNIRIDNIKDGAWELRQITYPPYRLMIAGDMIIDEDLTEIAPLGFFSEEFRFPAVLEDGNEWMTLTPVDLDTSDEAIDAASGRVVTFGLGLGYYAYMCSMKPEVESITVVEKSADVIRLFKKHILPQFPNKDKVIIVNDDAFRYAEEVMPRENFDLAFVDTWRDASDGTPMYLRMREAEKLSPKTRFLYWIENFLISRRRAILYQNLVETYGVEGILEKLSFEAFEKLLKL